MINEMYRCDSHQKIPIPIFLSPVRAGFPSPADDYIETSLDLNEHLIRHPAATFFVRVTGDSMTGAGIFPKDILIVDRSLRVRHQDVVVAVLDGEFTVKRFFRRRGQVFFMAENPDYEAIKIHSEQSLEIWGVVVHVIHSFRA